MAKTKPKKAAPKKAPKKKTGRRPPRPISRVLPDPRAAAFAKALADPCNAPLEHGVYPGQMGFISRFSQAFTVSTGATGTAFVLAVTPGRGISLSAVGATDATVISGSFLNSFVPGATFMTTNCRGARALGACIEFFTNQNALNATGTYFYGNLPHAALANGVGTYSQMGGLTQHMSKVNAESYYVNWRPGPLDEYYQAPNVNVTADDWDDVNSMVVIGTGFPNNTTITAKVTIIMEWLPAQTLGFATPVAANATGVKPTQVLAALDHHHPNWWAGKIGNAAGYIWKHGGAELASSLANTAARVVASAVPMLL